MANIKETWGNDYVFVIVAQEKHQDEEPHLHVIVKFKTQVDYEDPHFADFIAGQHGNYVPVKSMNHAIEYVQKDGDFITAGVLPKKYTEQKPKIGDSVIKAIDEGATMEVIRKTFPLYWMMHNKKIQEYYNAQQAEMSKALLPDFPGFEVPNPIADPYGYAVATWINKNFMHPRAHKQKQLWLCGPPDIGKTYIINQLKQYFLMYHPAKGSKWYDGFSEDVHKAIIFDEYKAQKSITEMNELLEGTTVQLEVKGAFVIKSAQKGNIPIIILSNFTPAEAYSNTNPIALAPLLTRLEVVQVLEDNYRFDLKIKQPTEEKPSQEDDPAIITIDDSPSITEVIPSESTDVDYYDYDTDPDSPPVSSGSTRAVAEGDGPRPPLIIIPPLSPLCYDSDSDSECTGCGYIDCQCFNEID